jgi:large subunit ribosomal protein L9
MPKTEVILIQSVIGLGAESDQVKVAAGYARNFLVPHGLAIPMSQGNRRRIEALKKRRNDRETHELNAMTELSKSMSKVTLTISVKTGEDGKMFGSVTNGTIADALKTQMDLALDKKKIHLERPIHTLGEHEVELRLHPEVRCNLKIVVKSSNPLPVAVAPVGSDKKEAEAPVREKRSVRNLGAKAPAAPAPEAKPAKAEKHEKPGKAPKPVEAAKPAKPAKK